MKVAKLTEGLNLIDAGITVLENIDSDEESVAMTRKSLENSLCCYKELLREKTAWRVVREKHSQKRGNYRYFLIENTLNNLKGLKKGNF